MIKVKLFIIIITIIFSSSIICAQEIDTTFVKKYYSLKKDPIKATILSFFFPGSGHVYAGNWKKALILGSAQSVFGYITFKEYLNNFHIFDPDFEENYTIFYSALMAGLCLKIYELASVNDEVGEYNKELAQLIFGKPIEIKNNYLLVIDGQVVF